MQKKLDQIVLELERLPSAPMAAARILRQVGNPALSMKALAETIVQEPVIARRLEQIARSPLYRTHEKGVNLEKALVRLGEEKIRELVIDTFLDSLCPGEEAEQKLLRDDALGCSLAARIVNGRSRAARPEDAFLAGLLRHTGKMAMFLHDREAWRKVDRLVRQGRADVVEAELCVFPFSHEELGASLLEAWQFPQLLAQATRHHHGFSQVLDLDPNTCLDPAVYNLAATLNLAEGLCACLGIGVETARADLDLAFLPGAIALSFSEQEVENALTHLKIQWADR